MPASSRAIIETVIPGSIAAQIGMKPGDEIISINDQRLQDLIDYQYLVAGETLNIAVRRPDGQVWAAEIEKEYDDDLGIGFTSAVFDNIRCCHNACIFCFIDQMPKGMRPTLYVKDDDYRLSFLYGNFITLTNVQDEDFARILRLHLSPMYISVHTTDAMLRQKMLRQSKAADLMPALQQLLDGGIDVHIQIVLCPGINNGTHMDKTIDDLSNLGPGILSIAVVPVGLTGHPNHLFPLRTFTAEEAAAVVRQVTVWQHRFYEKYGEALIYLSDEFYFAAKTAIPDYDHYGDFPQIENGVGLTRLFWEKWAEAINKIPLKIVRTRKVSVVTGISGVRVLAPLLKKLQVDKLTVQLIPVQNRFFGEHVTVTGLLTGKDIITSLQNSEVGDAVILPGIALRQEDGVFLDDLTVGDIAEEITVPVYVAYSPEELLAKILGLSDS